MLLGMSSLALGATVARRGGSAHEADPPTVPSGAQTAAVPAEPKTQTKPAKAPQQAPSNGEVERRVLTEVLSLSSRPLPASLVDQRTRLLRTNVRAVCRPHGSLRFDCSVEPPQGSRGKKLPVIVQVHAGKWHFAWGFARRR
jgi:hypothetical protein